MTQSLYKNLSFSLITKHLVFYPTPTNINYLWNFGFISGIFLTIQILSGIFLAKQYTAHIDFAYNSIEHIMRDVNYGWLLRYMHANGASFFFLVVYLHLARGLFFSSYSNSRAPLWISGVLIFILMMAIAFLGYILPWGQMSFWGATVITNLFSAIPFIGNDLAFWLWGGYSVDNATLIRFFSLHYLLPFVLLGVVIVHLFLLHIKGSTNPCGTEISPDIIAFYPYFYYKDLVGFLTFFFVYLFFVFYYPNYLGHTDNYIPANPLVTPTHIVPEWYFLPFYAILRAIPDKLGGVVAMAGALIALLCLPFITTSFVRTSRFRGIYIFFCFFFIFDFLLLGWLGGQPVTPLFIFLGRLSTVYYFFYLLIFLPLFHLVEKTFILRKFNTILYKIFFGVFKKIGIFFIGCIFFLYLFLLFAFIPEHDDLAMLSEEDIDREIAFVKKHIGKISRFFIYYFPLIFIGCIFLSSVNLVLSFSKHYWVISMDLIDHELLKEQTRGLYLLARRQVGQRLLGIDSPIGLGILLFLFFFCVVGALLAFSPWHRLLLFFFRPWDVACELFRQGNAFRMTEAFLGFVAVDFYKYPDGDIRITYEKKRSVLFLLTYLMFIFLLGFFLLLFDNYGYPFYIIDNHNALYDNFIARFCSFLFTLLFFVYFISFYSVLIEDSTVDLSDVCGLFLCYLVSLLVFQIVSFVTVFVLLEVLLFLFAVIYLRKTTKAAHFMQYLIISTALFLMLFLAYGALQLSVIGIESFLNLAEYFAKRTGKDIPFSFFLFSIIFVLFLSFKLAILTYSTVYAKLLQNSSSWFYVFFNVLMKFPPLYVLHFFCTTCLGHIPYFREMLFVFALITLVFNVISAAASTDNISVYNLYSGSTVFGLLLLFLAIADSGVVGFILYFVYFIYAMQSMFFFSIKNKFEMFRTRNNVSAAIQFFPLFNRLVKDFPKFSFILFFFLFSTSGFPLFLGFYLKVFAIEHVVLNYGFIGNVIFGIYILVHAFLSYFYYTKILHGLFFERVSFVYAVEKHGIKIEQNIGLGSLNQYFGKLSIFYFIFSLLIAPAIVFSHYYILQHPDILNFFNLELLLKHYHSEFCDLHVAIHNKSNTRPSVK